MKGASTSLPGPWVRSATPTQILGRYMTGSIADKYPRVTTLVLADYMETPKSLHFVKADGMSSCPCRKIAITFPTREHDVFLTESVKFITSVVQTLVHCCLGSCHSMVLRWDGSPIGGISTAVDVCDITWLQLSFISALSWDMVLT